MNYELLRQTPILIIAFAPIKNISLLIDRMKQIEPQRLYLVCSGAKTDKEDDYYRQIQQLIVGCHRRFRIKNLYKKSHSGYTRTLRKAISWFFRQETKGIILDGNVIPSSGALDFYSILLEKYRNDERIGHIAGWNFLNDNTVLTNDSYFFSKLFKLTGCWGSWRRVWNNFDAQLKTFPAFKKQHIIDHIPTHKPFSFDWFRLNDLKDSLEMQCEYINLISNRLTVVPNFKLENVCNDIYKWDEIKYPLFITNNNTFDLKYQENKYQLQAFTRNVPDGYLYVKNQLISMSYPGINRMKIPRIIHQIYEDTAGPPQNLLILASTWKKKHPSWEYRFWDRQMIHDFLESKCPDFLPYYYSYPFDVQRWDSIRYLILYHIGGLYVDLDYECLEPLDMLLYGQTCCMGMEPAINNRILSRPLLIGNALMASTPKHPYMAAIIKDMKTNFTVDYKISEATQIMESTGPFMVSRVYKQFKRKSEVTLLSADLVAPLTLKEVSILRTNYSTIELEEKIYKAFAVHYFFGSWFTQTAEGKARKKLLNC